MNIDATISVDDHSIGIGAAIRNSHGQVMAALAKKVNGAWSPKLVEAKALALSLLWAICLNLQIMESDALAIVNYLNKKSLDIIEFHDLLIDVCIFFK